MNYYLTGYSKITGYMVYRSALTDNLKELLIERENLKNTFNFILRINKI